MAFAHFYAVAEEGTVLLRPFQGRK
jgi:hypothetical protein